jgi:hypothetical protein
MSRPTARQAALVAFLALAAPASARQDPAPAEKAASTPVERLAEWPKLETEAAKNVKIDVAKLRKASTPEMGEQAVAALVAAGAGVAPELLGVLGKERDAQARLRVENVLDQITGAAHTRLLMPYFADKSRDVRSWALRRCGAFPDSAIAKEAEAALAAAKAVKAKDPKAEGIDREVFSAVLCTTAAGSHAALDLVAIYAKDQWGKYGAELRPALEAVRDETATKHALELVASDDRGKKVAGLNMLAGCGTKSAIAPLRPLLDSTDNSIRVATINALRGIVDGDPPIANLPVFEAIELAKKWKEKAR